MRLNRAAPRPDFPAVRTAAALDSSNVLYQITMVLVTLTLNHSLVYYGASSEYGSEIPLVVEVKRLRGLSAAIPAAVLFLPLSFLPLFTFCH